MTQRMRRRRLGLHDAPSPALPTPKKRGPLQRVPVMARATLDRLAIGRAVPGKAVAQHHHPMLGAAPLPHQQRAGRRPPAPGTATGADRLGAPAPLAEPGEQAQRGLVAIAEGVGLQPVGQDLEQQVRGMWPGALPAHEPPPVQPQRRRDRGRAGARPRLRPALVSDRCAPHHAACSGRPQRRCGRPRLRSSRCVRSMQ